ncbi:MAG: hypothetical protein AAGF47_07015 [Planctomycetota bacterium]
MAWTYSDWVTIKSRADRLARLRLHVQEISEKIDIDYEADGFKRLASPVRLYYDRMMKEVERLERVGGRGRRVPQVIGRGRRGSRR